MTDQRLYCDEPECDRPVAGHGKDKCSSHLKQLQRTGKCSPIAEKLTPEERAMVAGTAMLEAESDEEYAARRRTFLAACKALGGKAGDRMLPMSDLADELRRRRSIETKNGLAAARARGVRLGRPPRVSDEELNRLFAMLKTGSAVARVLKMHQASINARIAKFFGKRSIPRNTALSPRPT